MICYVYRLLDPWEGVWPPFYIGVSNNPWYRFYSHCHDRTSAPYPLLKLFMKYGVPRDDILEIYQECKSRKEAFELEYHLVATTSDLMNRPYRRGRSY